MTSTLRLATRLPVAVTPGIGLLLSFGPWFSDLPVRFPGFAESQVTEAPSVASAWKPTVTFPDTSRTTGTFAWIHTGTKPMAKLTVGPEMSASFHDFDALMPTSASKDAVAFASPVTVACELLMVTRTVTLSSMLTLPLTNAGLASRLNFRSVRAPTVPSNPIELADTLDDSARWVEMPELAAVTFALEPETTWPLAGAWLEAGSTSTLIDRVEKTSSIFARLKVTVSCVSEVVTADTLARTPSGIAAVGADTRTLPTLIPAASAGAGRFHTRDVAV